MSCGPKSGGLNTAVQVQEMSLMELQNEFDWIKKEITASRMGSGSHTGKVRTRLDDARDVVVLLDRLTSSIFRTTGRSIPFVPTLEVPRSCRTIRQSRSNTRTSGRFRRTSYAA